MAERVRFAMHKNLLSHVIKSQAGSIWKAVLEAVMNSIDAGATRIIMRINEQELHIEDNGRGFRSKKEVRDWFATFGTPHDQEKEFGRFRMGRGQIFSFGTNRWRSGQWQMDVDISKDGEAFDLEKLDSPVSGCYIDVKFYKPINSHEISWIKREIEQAVKYVKVEVLLNDEPLTESPDRREWTHEDDDAFYLLDASSSLKLYNRGAFVKTLGTGELGSGGIIVSKKKLDVNFARNDVMESCEIWQRIRAVVKRKANGDLWGRSKLSDYQRIFLIRTLIDNPESWSLARRTPLFPDVTGKYWSPERLIKHEAFVATVCDEGDRVGERLQQRGGVFVFSQELFTLFSVSNWNALLVQANHHKSLAKFQFKPFSQLRKDVDESSLLLADHELSERERVTLDILRKSQYWLTHCHGNVGRKLDKHSRRLIAGVSDVSEAWTDGDSYIAIKRELLHGSRWGAVDFWCYLGMVLAHEYAHDENTANTHVHGNEFYHDYHDLTINNQIGRFLEACTYHLAKTLEAAQERVKKSTDRKNRHRQRAAEILGLDPTYFQDEAELSAAKAAHV